MLINDNSRPPAQDSTGLQEIGFVSVSTGAVCADLGQVPNQPLVFKVNEALSLLK